MSRKGTLNGNVLTIANGEQVVMAVTFGPGAGATERNKISRQILYAPDMAAFLVTLKRDLDLIVGELIAEHGGGATGVIEAERQVPLIFERKRQLEALLPKLGEGQ